MGDNNMAAHLLMPRATAVWLVDNTSLTFEQIAELCQIHLLEVKAIADGETTQNILGIDPVINGQISREEITKAEQDPNYKIKLSTRNSTSGNKTQTKRKRYTPLSKRHDRPNAILWLIRNYPNLKDTQIVRLVGTTKSTIEQVRDRSHWNSANLIAIDPVVLGLCTQTDFNKEVEKLGKKEGNEEVADSKLLPSSYTENL